MTTALKGHAMNRGTLMVLKRLMVTVLSALGLGALAVGSASAQEIPAPDLFNGQVACKNNVPTPPASLAEALKAKVDGNATIALDASGVPTGDDSGLADILYVIDPENGNCGGGVDDQGAPIPIASGIAADVGAAYTDALNKYNAKLAADAAFKTADDALNALLNDEIGDDTQETLINAAREARTAALNAQTTANNEFNAASQGPINMAGVAEWQAKAAVDSAVARWNTAVNDAADKLTELNDSSYANYVPLRSVSQIDGLFDRDGNLSLVNLRQYANVEGGNTAIQDPDTGVITGADNSNFDASGNLIVPKSIVDGALVDTTSAQDYSAVSARLDSVKGTVAALEKAQSENQNSFLDGVFAEAVRRAKLERDHYQAQFDGMIADNTDLDTATEGVQSLQSRYTGYNNAVTERTNAGQGLTGALADRETATAAVRNAFTNPQDFYQQLVDRRTLLKSRAEAEVARLDGLTGDDTPDQATKDAAAKAVTDADTALTAAKNAQGSFQNLLAEDSPVRDLVLETLKPDSGEGQGDDGGVLIETIDGAYDAAAAAQSTADTVAQSVEDLVGEGGSVAVNSENIEALDGRVTTNEGNISTNADNIATNAGNISTNADNIATNAGNISTNAGNIVANRGLIDTNAADIMTNAGNISTNAGNISANTTAIGENRSAISANESAIGALRNELRSEVGELSEALDVVRAGVAASMALAGMPAINGRGISIGVGSYDGESAFAVGFQIQGEQASFKIGVTSSGGETGASAGVGFQF